MAFLSGLIEPIGTHIGFMFSTLTLFTLPPALAFTGGAMFFVTFQEMSPELCHKNMIKNCNLWCDFWGNIDVIF